MSIEKGLSATIEGWLAERDATIASLTARIKELDVGLDDANLTATLQTLIDTHDVAVRGRCIGRLVNHIKALTAQLAAAEKLARITERALRETAHHADDEYGFMVEVRQALDAIDSALALTSSRGTG